MMSIVVAIDGPGGAGKSTVSRRLAAKLGYAYVDTGAMYRIVGVLAAEQGLAIEDADALAALCDHLDMEFVERDGVPRVIVAGRDLTEAIRTSEAAQNASRFSTQPTVRERLVEKQRAMGRSRDTVMEGRDIGTVVFPDALLKVFLDASPIERARRRAAEMHGAASQTDIDRMAEEIAERDRRDRGRAHSPLKAADDAIELDTTTMGIEEVISKLHSIARERVAALAS